MFDSHNNKFNEKLYTTGQGPLFKYKMRTFRIICSREMPVRLKDDERFKSMNTQIKVKKNAHSKI